MNTKRIFKESAEAGLGGAVLAAAMTLGIISGLPTDSRADDPAADAQVITIEVELGSKGATPEAPQFISGRAYFYMAQKSYENDYLKYNERLPGLLGYVEDFSYDDSLAKVIDDIGERLGSGWVSPAKTPDGIKVRRPDEAIVGVAIVYSGDGGKSISRCMIGFMLNADPLCPGANDAQVKKRILAYINTHPS